MKNEFRILLIEDEEPIRFGFSRYLQKQNYIADQACCISEARARLRIQVYDAFILDLDLPDGDGWVYLDELRRENPDVPIIIVSGSASRDAEECIIRGANYFLAKPVSMEEIHAALERLINLRYHGNL